MSSGSISAIISPTTNPVPNRGSRQSSMGRGSPRSTTPHPRASSKSKASERRATPVTRGRQTSRSRTRQMERISKANGCFTKTLTASESNYFPAPRSSGASPFLLRVCPNTSRAATSISGSSPGMGCGSNSGSSSARRTAIPSSRFSTKGLGRPWATRIPCSSRGMASQAGTRAISRASVFPRAKAARRVLRILPMCGSVSLPRSGTRTITAH